MVLSMTIRLLLAARIGLDCAATRLLGLTAVPYLTALLTAQDAGVM